jgi:hypothetical protein
MRAAVGAAVGALKRPLEQGGEQADAEPAAKKKSKIIRCNACLLQLGVVRLKSEHAQCPGRKCPAEKAPVGELQAQARQAMGMASSREFSGPDFVVWFARAKAQAKGGPIPGPVQELSYTSAAFEVDCQQPNLKGLRAAVEQGYIKMQP